MDNSKKFQINLRIFIIFLLILKQSHADDSDEDEDCIFNVQRDMDSIEPLLMTTKSPAEFIYPKQSNPTTVQIDDEEHLRLVCNDRSIFVTCRDRLFWIDGTKRKFTMKTFYCWDPRYSHFIRQWHTACPSNVVCLQIGFQINVIDFIPTIDMIFFNPGRKRPLWAHAKVVSIINYRQLRGESSGYKKDLLFDRMSLDVDDIFDRDYQRRRLTRILKSQSLADEYINDEGYLVKGQLIDNDSFFYKPQQDTVHYYANVMPVWYTVDEGNWFLAGEIVRRIASDLRSDLDLWSGSMETLELEDSGGVKREIYLGNEDGQEVIPVPKFLFKYVYDWKSNRGLAIITVNNPFLKKLSSGYKLCEEYKVCSILNPSFKSFETGYTYCCTVQDFEPIAKRRGLPTFPQAQQLL